MVYDYSTLNLTALKKRPLYKLPPTYHLQRDPGNGCAFDPPGYPSYFTRSVYTQYGNTPSRGPQLVIVFEEENYIVASSHDWVPGLDWDGMRAKQDRRLRSLWEPLSFEHPRTQEWVRNVYRHFQHCYAHPAELEHGQPKTVLFPVPYYEVISKSEEEVELYKKEIAQIAIPERHSGYLYIKRFYPEVEPNLAFIETPPTVTTTWWERYAEEPTPENCPGQFGHKHPVNGTWCQVCGWHDKGLQ